MGPGRPLGCGICVGKEVRRAACPPLSSPTLTLPVGDQWTEGLLRLPQRLRRHRCCPAHLAHAAIMEPRGRAPGQGRCAGRASRSVRMGQLPGPCGDGRWVLTRRPRAVGSASPGGSPLVGTGGTAPHAPSSGMNPLHPKLLMDAALV